MRVLLGQRQHLRKFRQIDRYAQGVADLIFCHLAEDIRQAGHQFRKIDMAMGVDIHDGRYFTPSPRLLRAARSS